jgi:hypothetical protein
MTDTVPFGEPVKHGNAGGAIICDDFLDGTPPAEDLFKYSRKVLMVCLFLTCSVHHSSQVVREQ